MSAMATREGRLTEWLLRAFALLLYVVLVANVARHWWADTSRYTLLLLLLTEGFTLGLVLFARRAVARDMSLPAIAATIYAVSFFALFGYADTERLAPEWVGASLLIVGLAWQVASKATLGRAFGLLPANRGLVTQGPYSVVRHPIYMGYLIGHVGFLLENFSLRNLLVLALLYVAQTVRMLREEAVLERGGQQAGYRAYRAAVRWRIVPYIF